MPRMGRIVLPDFPHHIVQRGHDRNVVFASESDYQYYLDTLAEFKSTYDVKVFSFCLMTNHVHLLLMPSDNKGLGLLMKRLAGRQTRYRNKLEGRSGTLWESRYKSSIVDAEAYLLACVRYIELNPVRANIVADPIDYTWSSYSYRVGKGDYFWLDEIPEIHSKSGEEDESLYCYESYIKDTIPQGEWDLIRMAVRRNQLTGNSRFTAEIDKITGRRIEFRGQGRPVKKGN
jgi:putative transposase